MEISGQGQEQAQQPTASEPIAQPTAEVHTDQPTVLIDSVPGVEPSAPVDRIEPGQVVPVEATPQMLVNQARSEAFSAEAMNIEPEGEVAPIVAPSTEGLITSADVPNDAVAEAIADSAPEVHDVNNAPI